MENLEKVSEALKEISQTLNNCNKEVLDMLQAVKLQNKGTGYALYSSNYSVYFSGNMYTWYAEPSIVKARIFDNMDDLNIFVDTAKYLPDDEKEMFKNFDFEAVPVVMGVEHGN